MEESILATKMNNVQDAGQFVRQEQAKNAISTTFLIVKGAI